jgi:hypothetical protein
MSEKFRTIELGRCKICNISITETYPIDMMVITMSDSDYWRPIFCRDCQDAFKKLLGR